MDRKPLIFTTISFEQIELPTLWK